ncbi:hypothetical protein OG762_44040 [Streptomyces sp. NBC_01136]|uniref:hypothetical protein n=1 Tax=unclassified Streptomyces TaxID=2593676 RepID=UPI0032516F1E|nr:hypothetical protein OG762_44040 [Streptomyces sp. NBC_01136]
MSSPCGSRAANSSSLASRCAEPADDLALKRLRQALPLSTEDARRHLNSLIETELRRRP